MRTLMDYPWPGNVRELENAIEHSFALCTGEHVYVFDLPIEIRQLAYRPEPEQSSPSTMVNSFSREKLSRSTLVDILKECDWNKAEVGRRVGLSRTAIWKYMKKWEIPLKPPS